MKLPWRPLPALLLAMTASAFVHPAPASATFLCTYYKYDTANARWHRAALLVDEDWYESQPGNQRYASWDCKYCYVPSPMRPPGPGNGIDVNEAVGLAQQEVAIVFETVQGVAAGPVVLDPSYPPCPVLPPEDPDLLIVEGT